MCGVVLECGCEYYGSSVDAVAGVAALKIFTDLYSKFVTLLRCEANM